MDTVPQITHEIIAASSGALITSLFVTPLDVVKTRLQVQQKNLISKRCFLYSNGLMDHLCYCLNGNNGHKSVSSHWINRPTHFHGTKDAFVKIIRNEGLASLWSGLSPTLVLAVPATVIYFLTYDKLKCNLYHWHQTNVSPSLNSAWVPLVAGSSARLLSATIVSPLELVRTKMQSAKFSYFQIGRALKSLVKSNGVVGLWKGLTPTLLRDIPFSAIYWSSLEFIKSYNTSKSNIFVQNFIAGAISGFVAATITLPFDVVKTHQQIDLGENVYKFSDSPLKSANMTTIFKKIYKENGLKGLFVGYVPRIIKIAPACAIMISVFEYGKYSLRDFTNQNNSDNDSVSIINSSNSNSNANSKIFTKSSNVEPLQANNTIFKTL